MEGLNKINGEDTAKEGYIFALDIGTRSVIGIVGRQEGDLFRIIATETVEHPKRAMIDGQIEDIQQVTQVAGKVRALLEQQVGFPLTRVCVAAAGRSLKTTRASHEITIPNGAELISAQTVYELEMGAVSAAREEINADFDKQQFYCVGYTVVRYYLDDYPFTTILGHKGSAARVDVIATFLPNEVVDSLCSAMTALGLEIENLTLEPIAAMNAVLPPDLRLLNLALVDIGAGTSDIAISDGGSVAAYTMATVAGDEITEELIRHYLLDFQTAEQMKHAAAGGDAEISYKDILGFSYTVALDEVLEVLTPAVTLLTKTICDKIKKANGDKPPVAVFLVGGGSKAPLVCEMVADALGLDRKKVAIGGNNFIKRVVQSDINLAGPEYATPIGIALTGAAAGELGGFFVFINGKQVRLFRNHASAVMDVLLMSGYQYGQLMGKSGKGFAYTLNGEKKLARGGHFQPTNIVLNGAPASISTMVSCGDDIVVEVAVQGEDARVFARDLTGAVGKIKVSLDDVLLDAGCWLLINGEPALPEHQLRDGDVVEKYEVATLEELCAQVGLRYEDDAFVVNGEVPGPDYLLQNEDEIVSRVSISSLLDVAEQEAAPHMPETAQPKVKNQEAAQPEEQELQDPVRHAVGVHIQVNGRTTTLARREASSPYLFVDMLNLVDIDPSKPQGDILLLLNGKNASYLDEVHDGDRVEIRWVDKER